MLGLHSDTSPEWLAAAEADLASVLRDHAHCEKKAALMAISLVNRYPQKRDLVLEMTELAQEELAHFRMVLDKMYERGIELSQDPGDKYAQSLHTQIRKQEPARLLDTLIVSSLIEARSCERFRMLSESIQDEDLRVFYRGLLESEARHRSTFLGLARQYFPREEVQTRLDELEAFEATLVRSLDNEPVMHG